MVCPAKTLKTPPDRREIFAATAKPSLRILSCTGTYTATSGSPHTGAKKSRRRLRNCSDLFTVAACTVFVAVAAYSAGFTFQFREFAPAGDKSVLCRQAPECRSRQVSFLFLIQSHIWICLHGLSREWFSHGVYGKINWISENIPNFIWLIARRLQKREEEG